MPNGRLRNGVDRRARRNLEDPSPEACAIVAVIVVGYTAFSQVRSERVRKQRNGTKISWVAWGRT